MNMTERLKDVHGLYDHALDMLNKRDKRIKQLMKEKPKQLHWSVLFLIGFVIGGLLTIGLKRAFADIPPSGAMKAACVAIERHTPFRLDDTVYLCETQTISGRKCVIARTHSARGVGLSCKFQVMYGTD